VRRERADYLLSRRPIANRPVENDVSLGPVLDARRSALVPDARAVREVQVLVPREGIEPDQPGPPDRRNESGKSGRDPTAMRIPEVCILRACPVGQVLPLVGEITALNWINFPARVFAPQFSDDGGPLLGCPRRLCVFSHASYCQAAWLVTLAGHHTYGPCSGRSRSSATLRKVEKSR
jgi:hypothetical protein